MCGPRRRNDGDHQGHARAARRRRCAATRSAVTPGWSPRAISTASASPHTSRPRRSEEDIPSRQRRLTTTCRRGSTGRPASARTRRASLPRTTTTRPIPASRCGATAAASSVRSADGQEHLRPAHARRGAGGEDDGGELGGGARSTRHGNAAARPVRADPATTSAYGGRSSGGHLRRRASAALVVGLVQEHRRRGRRRGSATGSSTGAPGPPPAATAPTTVPSGRARRRAHQLQPVHACRRRAAGRGRPARPPRPPAWSMPGSPARGPPAPSASARGRRRPPPARGPAAAARASTRSGARPSSLSARTRRPRTVARPSVARARREVGLDGRHSASTSTGPGGRLGQRAHVGRGGDEHAPPRGPRLGGQAVDERRLAARAHHRDDVAAADAERGEQPASAAVRSVTARCTRRRRARR